MRKLLIGMFVVMMFGFTSPAYSDSCDDQMRVDQRDNPKQAESNWMLCGFVVNYGPQLADVLNLDLTTGRKQRSRNFQSHYKIAIANAGRKVPLATHEQVLSAYDPYVLMGLRRAGREDLIGKWLATHNPSVLYRPK